MECQGTMKHTNIFQTHGHSVFHCLAYLYCLIHYFYSSKIGATAKNGLQIRILHQKLRNMKEKSRFLYALKLNNTSVNSLRSVGTMKIRFARYHCAK